MFQSTDPQRDLFPPPVGFRLYLALRSRVLRLLRRHVDHVVVDSVPSVEDAPRDPPRRARGYRTRSSPKAPTRRRRARRPVDRSPSPGASPKPCSTSGVDSSTSISCRETFSNASAVGPVRLVVADLERDSQPRPVE